MKLTGYYTKAGEKIAAGLLAGKTLSIARITAGSGSTSTAASALDQEQQDLGPSAPEVSGTTAVIRCTLSSDQAKAPYFLRELGVYALDETGRQVLYLIFRLDEQVSVNPAFRLVLRFNLEQTLSDGAAVKVTAPLTGLATREEVDAKADLVGGQVPYAQTPHLTGDKRYYVDAAIGDDSNNGTSLATPFKTIQRAVDALPKDLGFSSAVISVAEGIYSEHIIISGFTGGYFGASLSISGPSEPEKKAAFANLTICNNAAHIIIKNCTVNGAGQVQRQVVVSASRAELNNLTVTKLESYDAVTGISVGQWGAAQASIVNCTVSGFAGSGISVSAASVAGIVSTTVKNCGVGVSVGNTATGSTGIVMARGMTFTGNTANTQVVNSSQYFGG